MEDEKIAVLVQNAQQHIQRLPIIGESRFLYVDMDNVLVDSPSGIQQLSATVAREYENRLDEVPGIFALMTPMPCAIESFFELAKKFDTYILSTSPWENPSAWSDKLLWVKRHMGQVAYKRLILSHHKNSSNSQRLDL